MFNKILAGKRKSAFTLAEVLITLVIIGVIAAITVPTLLNNIRGEEYRTAYKKSISALNQAIRNHYATTGKQVADYASFPELITGLFAKEMHLIDDDSLKVWCVKGEDPECSDFDGVISELVFNTADGARYGLIEFWGADGSHCDLEDKRYCAFIFIDVNGNKGPNSFTEDSRQPKDQYQAAIYNSKVVPWEEASQGVFYGSNR